MSIDPFAPAHELARAIRRKKLGSLELLEFYLQRVEKFNPQLNAIVAMDEAQAIVQARRADRMTLRGESMGPLHGVPMTIKESFDVVGMPSTWGRMDCPTGMYPAGNVSICSAITNIVMLQEWVPNPSNSRYGTWRNVGEVLIVEKLAALAEHMRNQ